MLATVVNAYKDISITDLLDLQLAVTRTAFIHIEIVHLHVDVLADIVCVMNAHNNIYLYKLVEISRIGQTIGQLL
jgi:hypothetical protein